jgi:tRNA pseudouridine32 synthase/23S rRNA pseudouridine746 synthase
VTESNDQGSLAPAWSVNDAASSTAIEIATYDEAWVAVDKPAGLPSVPGRTSALADCAWSRVRQRWPDALVVHRLDMATSGLLLFARGRAVQRCLSRAFAAREVRKTYVALVHGRVADDEGTIDLPLAADWPRRPRQIVDHDRGKPSLTRWRVLQRCGGAPHTLLELEPLTGRTHQLRVHVAAIGHAIVGDALYGPDGSAGASEPQRCMRLHALSIELLHPITGALATLRTTTPTWMYDDAAVVRAGAARP